MLHKNTTCHSRESGNLWIPAFAGMTVLVAWRRRGEDWCFHSFLLVALRH